MGSVEDHVCSTFNLVILLKNQRIRTSTNRQTFEINRIRRGFSLEVYYLNPRLSGMKFLLSKKFRNQLNHEAARSIVLSPREDHILVSSVVISDLDGGLPEKLGRIVIFRMDPSAKLHFLSSINLSQYELSGLRHLKFHGYVKTKFVFSGLTLNSGSTLFTFVYDFEVKKVVLVKKVRTALDKVRRVSRIGSSLVGVDDYCKRFEIKM